MSSANPPPTPDLRRRPVLAFTTTFLVVLLLLALVSAMAGARHRSTTSSTSSARATASSTGEATADRHPTTTAVAEPTHDATHEPTHAPTTPPHPSSPTPNATATQAALATQTAAAQATQSAGATATATAFFAQPYFAARPGSLCDSGGAVWLAYPDTRGMTCSADSTQLTGGMALTFTSPYGNFPPNFTATVDVLPGATCGWLSWRFHDISTPGGSIGICAGGGWNIKYGWTQGPLGNAGTSTVYTLSITVQHGVQTVSLNGSQLDQHTIDPGALPAIAVAMGMNPGDTQTLAFRNFTLTPLP